MKRYAIFNLLLLLLGACSEREPNYILKIKLQKLDKASMYNTELVGDVIFDAAEQNLDSLKNKSRQLFLQGINFYKNKKNPEKAVELFTSSILTFPEAKTYYELGNALMEMGGQENFEQALKAYNVTSNLGFEPKSNVLYNEACAYYQLYQSPFLKEESTEDYGYDSKEYHLNQAVSSLREAFNEGFYDTTLLKTDPKLRGIIYKDRFKEMYLSLAASKLKGNGNGLYSLYLNAFPRVENSFEIKLEEVEMPNYSQSISYDFAPYIAEMENVSFGRSVSNDFYYVARLAPQPNYTAVIYKSTSFQDMESQPIHTMLATYSPHGELISKVMLSCSCSPSKVKAGKIEDGKITIEEYKRTWQEPIDKVPFSENKVIANELQTTYLFSIDESGKIMQGINPVPVLDSTSSAANSSTITEQKN